MAAFTELVIEAGPVLVAGAGPAALMAALELSRQGVPVRIVDNAPALPAASRAAALYPRTASLLARRGLMLPELPGGCHVKVAGVYQNGRLLGTVRTAGRQERDIMLLGSQVGLERMLRDRLVQQGITVEHDTQVTGVGQPGPEGGPDGLVAVLKRPDGRRDRMRVPYLIYADAGDTAIGHAVGHREPGRSAGPGYLLADLWLGGDLPDDEISIFLGNRGFLVALPTGDGWFRCIATQPESMPGDLRGPAQAAMHQAFSSCLPVPVRPQEVSRVSWQPALVRTFPGLQRGRVFLAGGAAHAYCLTSGHGMNFGIQDMINLCWKLAMVLNGRAAPELLTTYAQERLPAIRDAARRAGQAADLLGTRSMIKRLLVRRIAPAFLDARFVLRLCADLIGEVVPSYQHSQLSARPRGPGDLQPGDCLPDIRVLASDPGHQPGGCLRETQLPDLADPSRLTLLFTAGANCVSAPAAWPGPLRPWGEIVRPRWVAPLGHNRDHLTRFQRAFGGGPGIALIRPDGYLGFAGRPGTMPHLADWLSRWFPVPATST